MPTGTVQEQDASFGITLTMAERSGRGFVGQRSEGRGAAGRQTEVRRGEGVERMPPRGAHRFHRIEDALVDRWQRVAIQKGRKMWPEVRRSPSWIA